ncbi:hypothetical protein BpJC7_16960 [Weizmannia acidilactici]|uniref:SGNH/GDSL hydrolase family protein n=1 Tax=Weizmannia acidilactici TaxID=2607726 RepID=A0A5J4JE74_9BACI|nr:hypothetical protein [Weizmannia acidilactici]GER70393.1 hypothetical protein BpJC7_16960 [Weizmannia acidilactici]
MKILATIMSILAAVVVFVAGNMYWGYKTDPSRFQDSAAEAKETKTTSETSAKMGAAKTSEKPNTDFTAYTAHWPKQARTDFKAAISKGRAYKIAIVGSDAMGIDSNGWGPQLKQALRKAYGSHVHVSLFAYDMNSDEFIREGKYKDVADFQPDLVLFEPFILNNNGAVAMENQLNDIKTAAAAWKDAVLLIQPSFPLYQATNYPDQVDQLEMFTKMEGYTYLNHWKNWPDPNSGKFKAYVKFENGEQTAPSAKGVKVWYEYLRDYFIAD